MPTLTHRSHGRVLLAGLVAWLSPHASLLASAAAPERATFAPVPESVYAGVPFEMPRVPVPQIPDRSVTLTDFGAIGDGKALNTGAFARAIGHLADQGGGRVVVPRGIWLTGPIVLRDNIELHTEAGALVLFSPERSLYPLVETNFEGRRAMRCQAPLSAAGATNIAITGSGVFDGNGQAWRPVKRMKMTENQWRALLASGGVLEDDGQMWWPSAEARNGTRPVMVSLRECRNILLDGPTFQNSPAWNLHPLLCENLVVRNLTVRNPWYSQNGDGLDLDSCRNGVIYGNTFDVGDDAICLKSGKDAEGRARGRPTENLVVRDNVVYHGHGGFVVGSEMSGGVRNIFAADLTFIGTDVGLRFKSTRGRGGVVENIHITDINMVDIPTEPIRFNLFYGGDAPTEGPATREMDPAAYLHGLPAVTEETPSFRNITVRNVVCRGAGGALWIQGLPEMPVQNLRLENIAITATRGARLIDVSGLQFDGVRILAAEGPVLQLHNAQDLVMHDSVAGGQVDTDLPLAVQVDGPLTRGVDLRGLTPQGGKFVFRCAATIAPGEVQVPGQ